MTTVCDEQYWTVMKVVVLKRCFDGFADDCGAIPVDHVGNILAIMGMKVVE